MTKLVTIAPVAGRVAFTAVSGGRKVDREMTVPTSLWIRDLIAAGDVAEIKPKSAIAPASATPNADAKGASKKDGAR